jgi:hypothetical protein
LAPIRSTAPPVPCKCPRAVMLSGAVPVRLALGERERAGELNLAATAEIVATRGASFEAPVFAGPFRVRGSWFNWPYRLRISKWRGAWPKKSSSRCPGTRCRDALLLSRRSDHGQEDSRTRAPAARGDEPRAARHEHPGLGAGATALRPEAARTGTPYEAGEGARWQRGASRGERGG